MYADFEYYTQEYLGNQIKEEDFPRLALRAGEYLDEVTFDRITSLNPVPQEVKKACCAVAELELRLESQEEGKSSETVGSYSVHWEPGRGEALSATRYQAAAEHLGQTGLMWPGVAP